MRERDFHGARTHGVSGRLLAFLLVFAMMLGVWPTAFADETAETSSTNVSIEKADVNFTGTKIGADNTVASGADFGLQFAVTFASDNTSGVTNPQVRLYIGDMSAETLPSIDNGGKISGVAYIADNIKYTVQYDEERKENYLLIEKYDDETKTTVPWVGGDTISKTFTAKFDSGTASGTAWNVELVITDLECNELTHNTGNTHATLTAVSSVTMNNTKQTAQSSVLVDNDATTLGTDIVYTLSAYTGDTKDDSVKLEDGEAAVGEYTVTDTFTLPTGLYIKADELNSAVSCTDHPNFTVASAATDVNGNVTSFTVTWTVTNASAAAQIEDFTAQLTLNGSHVQVDSSFINTKDSKVQITNQIETAYKTVNEPTEEKKVAPVSVSTDVYRPTEGGYKNMSKTIAGAASNYDTWNYGGGYLVEGDYVLYKISYTNSSDNAALTGTVTDTLPQGLKFAKITDETKANELISLFIKSSNFWELSTDKLYAGAWATSGDTTVEPTISDNTITFSNVTTDANGTFTAYILAKVTETTTKTITNTATIGTDEVSASFENRAKTPKLEISKTVKNNDHGDYDTMYNAGDEVTYTVTVKNSGTADMTGISLRDMFPKDVTVSTISIDGEQVTEGDPYSVDTASDDSVDKYTFTSFNLAAGESKVITITGTVKLGVTAATIRNTATAEWTTTTVSAEATLTRVNPASYVTIEKAGDHDGQYVKTGDTVTYTITVGMGNTTFGAEEPLVVYDILPSALTYVNSGSTAESTGTAVTPEEQTDGSIKYTITGTGTVEITVTATVNDTASANTAIVNKAMISGGSSAESGISYVGSSDDMTAVKSAVVYRTGSDGTETKIATIASGESAAVQAGDRIEFTIVVKNNTSAAITEFSLYDTLVGTYKIEHKDSDSITPNLGVSPYPIHMTVKNSINAEGLDNNYYWGGYYSVNFVGNMYKTYDTSDRPYTVDETNEVITSTGTSEIKFTSSANGDNPTLWANSSFSLGAGGSITLTYSVTAAESFTTGSNSVKVGALSTTESTVSYAVEATENPDPSVSADPNATPTPPASNAVLSIDKTVSRSFGGAPVNELVFSSANDFDDTYGKAIVMYHIAVKNESDTAYTTTNAVIYDRLPNQFGLQANSVNNDLWLQSWYGSHSYHVAKVVANADGSEDYANADWNLVDDSYCTKTKETRNTYDANWLKICLQNSATDETFTLRADETVDVYYYLRLTPEIVKQLTEENANTDTFWFEQQLATNTGYFTADTRFKNTDGNLTQVIADTQTVTIRSETAHPGLEKKAYAYIQPAGDEIKYGTSGAQPGDRLIWYLKISNDKDTNGTGADMTKYTLTDMLPEGYKYIEDQTYTNTNTTTPVRYPDDLSDENHENLQKGEFVIHRADGNTVDTVEYNTTGITFKEDEFTNTLTWEFDSSQNNTLKLAAGDWLEFTIITEPESKVYHSGVYYNKAVLTVDDKYYESTVSVGTVEDGEITDGDSFSMNTILTSASISATAGDKTATGGTENNVLEVDSGTPTVTYTLTVKNEDPTSQSIKNLAIINRLPYVGDSGVLVSGQRGSEYDAVYADSMTITICSTDANNAEQVVQMLTDDDFTFTTYSGDASRIFTETSVDWTQLDAEGWEKSYDAATKLIRINIGNDENPITLAPGQYIKITYSVTLPDGEDTELTGWNGFAYRYDSEDGDVTNMAAEPASVGVKIPADDALTGSIRVKKSFASDSAAERTFYFICEDENGNRYGGVKSIKLKSSGSLASPVNAEVTFTDLPYTEIGKSVYYYIYETDENGNKLKQSDTDYVMYKGFYRTDKYSYDFTDKTNPKVTQDGEPVTDNITYVGDDEEAYWKKGLNPSTTSNSAIFSNILFSKATYKITGPLYADVPFSADSMKDDTLTSTRKDDNGDDREQDSKDRGKNEFDDSKTIYAGAYDGFGGKENGHTISTGFLAEITPGSDVINGLTWNITTHPEKNNVYVRAESDSKNLGVLELGDAKYTDGKDDTGYSIFNVTSNESYTFKITDDNITKISGAGTAYVGIIIDQIYDQNAEAAIDFSYEGEGPTVKNNGGDVGERGTRVNKFETIRGLTSINYEIALNDVNKYVNSTEGAALKANVIAELKKNGITLDVNTVFHDSKHGTKSLKTIDIDAPGPLKITIGDCLYGADTVELLDESGNVLDSTKMQTGCYHNDSSEVVLNYTGSAAKLQIKFSSSTYVPYLKVESTGEAPTTPTEDPTTPSEEPAAPSEEPAESKTYTYTPTAADVEIAANTKLIDSSDIAVYTTSTVTSEEVTDSNFSKDTYPYSLPFRANSHIDSTVTDFSNITYTNSNSNKVSTSVVAEPKTAGTITVWVGINNAKPLYIWDNTTAEELKEAKFDSKQVNTLRLALTAGHQYIIYAKDTDASLMKIEYITGSASDQNE